MRRRRSTPRAPLACPSAANADPRSDRAEGWWGIFGTPSGKSRGSEENDGSNARDTGEFSAHLLATLMACLLRQEGRAPNVFRAAVVAIVLTLMAGPNARLLCLVSCHPEAVGAGPCEHQDQTSPPSVTANDSCPDISAASSAFVQEQVRRAASPSASQAIWAMRIPVAPPPGHSAPAPKWGHGSAREARPLVTTLRI